MKNFGICKQLSRTSILAAAGLSLLVTGCVTDPNTGEKKISRAAIIGAGGALGGYLLGDLVGGRNDRTEKILGAGIGALAGAGVGYYLDEQERKLKQDMAGTGVDVTREGDSLILNMPAQVTFDVDSSYVKPDFQYTLDKVSQTLSLYEKSYIDVYGHTDSTGSDAYNQLLSERRAQSVASYLSARNVHSARIATRGFGETQPVADNLYEQGRAQNRRVEIRIVPITEQDAQNYG